MFCVIFHQIFRIKCSSFKVKQSFLYSCMKPINYPTKTRNKSVFSVSVCLKPGQVAEGGEEHGGEPDEAERRLEVDPPSDSNLRAAWRHHGAQSDVWEAPGCPGQHHQGEWSDPPSQSSCRTSTCLTSCLSVLQNLEGDLQEAERQSAQVRRIHLQHLERLRAQRDKRLMFVQQQWENGLQHLSSMFSSERSVWGSPAPPTDGLQGPLQQNQNHQHTDG